jgi:hypothetical protein
MSGERAWSSEDTEPFSFKVVCTVFLGIVIGLEIRSKAPKLNVRLEAETYWLRCGRVTPRSDVNFNRGIRDKLRRRLVLNAVKELRFFATLRTLRGFFTAFKMTAMTLSRLRHSISSASQAAQ